MGVSALEVPETKEKEKPKFLKLEPIPEKIVFCSGISGSERKQYLEEVKEYAKLNGKEIRIYDLEAYMYKVSKEYNIEFRKDSFLNLGKRSKDFLRAAAFESMLRDLDTKFTSIVTSHATFFWKDDFSLAFDFSYLEILKPDMYITIIHSIHRIKENLESGGGIKLLSDEEILYWQNVECLSTRIMAQAKKKEFYLIARRQPPSTLFNLIFRPEVRRVYLSYPMSFASEEMVKKIKSFRRKLEEKFIVFDPGTVEEIEMIGKLNYRARRIVVNQTVSRDFQLIDQSDFVVAYFPEIIFSSGVDSECIHASNTGKKVWIVFPNSTIPPFTSYHADRVFKSEEEFYEFLENLK